MARWESTARPSQLLPPGAWSTWLILAGRGFGKTRTGAETASNVALRHAWSRIAVVAPTAADARDTCVEGDSGLLSVIPHECIRSWNRSLGELVLKNGSRFKCFSAEEPERLRGPQHHFAWADELAAWRRAETWDQLIFGLRLGRDPRAIVTTTPKPTPVVRALAADPKTHLTRGSTFENEGNIAPAWLDELKRKYVGTRLGRQELEAELLLEVEGALFNAEMFRRVEQAPKLGRIVIAVDPSGARSMKDVTADEIGIVAAGLGQDGRAYVLEDLSFRAPPSIWAQAIERAYKRHVADCVVVESNYGGPMAEALIRTIDPAVRVKNRTAARAKHVRAEPIAGLYEQGRVVHVGRFPELEDQLCQFTVAGYVGPGSPDRADALVWAIDELIISAAPTVGAARFSLYAR